MDAVIAATDVTCIYELPIRLHKEGLDQQLVERLNIWSRQPDLSQWKRVVERMLEPSKGSVSIALVGKYVHLRDAYKSLHEAIVHGGLANDLQVNVHYVDSEELQREPDAHKMLGGYDAILVPGGFGDRGLEGKIKAIRYAREQGVPFFGICLGMQMAVVEFARHACHLDNADSVEADPQTPCPVIHLMPGQRGIQDKGRDDATGRVPLSAGRRFPGRPHLRSRGDQRASSPPFRSQQRVPRRSREGRHALVGLVARSAARRDG